MQSRVRTTYPGEASRMGKLLVKLNNLEFLSLTVVFLVPELSDSDNIL